MRDSIIVSISELRSLVQDARRTGKQYVQLSILEPLDDSDGGEPVPSMHPKTNPNSMSKLQPLFT